MSDVEKDQWGTLLSEKPSLEKIKEHFKGKSGGPEGESHICDSNLDKKKGLCGSIAPIKTRPKSLRGAVMQFWITAF